MMVVDLDRGSFGPVLRRMRLAAQISQEELAERAHLSVESISALERGRRRVPYRETIKLLADALRLPENERRELAEAARRSKPAVKSTISYDSLQEPSLFTNGYDAVTQREGQLHNVPSPATSLIGRETELHALRALALKHRLLTIVGAGGTGKTRLVVELVRSLYELAKVDTFFIDLAPLREVSLITATLCATIGVTSTAAGADLEAITKRLGATRTLLVVDNCEHLIDEVGRIVARLLATCRQMQIVTTSREALEIGGEAIFRLASLHVPPEVRHLSPDDIRSFSAVKLFIERAQACNRDLIIGPTVLSDVARICRRLDGIPLAIELAASRSQVLSIAQIQHRIQQTFDILTSGKRGLLPRQQTLRALIDWSYDLLDDDERELLRRLSIFAGGWTLAALQAIYKVDALSNEELEGRLFSLVQKSLVVVDVENAGTRYRLLESTRLYAREKLTDADLEELQRRHAIWVREFAAAAYDLIWELPHSDWMRLVSPELGNIRLALTTMLGAKGDVMSAAQIVTGVFNIWFESGLLGEGRHWIDATIEKFLVGEDQATLGRLWWVSAIFTSGKHSVAACEKAIALLESASDPWDLSNAYLSLGIGLWQVGQASAALDATSQAIEYASQSDKSGTSRYAQALNLRGLILAGRGDVAAARDDYMQSFELSRAIMDQRGMGETKANIAELEFLAGNTDKAIMLVDEATAIFSSLGVTSRLAALQANSAAYRLTLGELFQARDHALNALRLGIETHDSLVVSTAIQHIATVLALEGHPTTAAILIGYANAWFEAEAYVREPSEQKLYEMLRSSLASQLTGDAIGKLMEHGRMFSERQAYDAAERLTDMDNSS